MLWRIGLRGVLPSAIVNRVEISECGDRLANIKNAGFFLSDELRKRKRIMLRARAAERLKLAQSKLPDGVFIKIYSAYRPLSEQQKLWGEKIAEMRREHPECDAGELAGMTRQKVADPRSGGGGHQTGGAVDVSLCGRDGRDLDMGGGYLEFDEKTPTKAVKNKNRKLLCSAMGFAGFANYPKEWWHFSYGDKMWAAYGRKKNAPYGAL
jgi:D-alanyl-D-alanine dipeptidase